MPSPERRSRARRGEGPSLIEIETCRLEGHFMGDAEGYRPAGEVERLKAADPIPAYRNRLIADGFDTADLDKAEADARAAVDAAFAAARAAAYPQPEEAFAHVFA
jgi:pyruvate dehydrogenase E1 component alpha subunit